MVSAFHIPVGGVMKGDAILIHLQNYKLCVCIQLSKVCFAHLWHFSNRSSNIVDGKWTRRSSHSELLDEELQATSCTLPTTSARRPTPLTLPCCLQTHVMYSTKSVHSCLQADGITQLFPGVFIKSTVIHFAAATIMWDKIHTHWLLPPETTGVPKSVRG